MRNRILLMGRISAVLRKHPNKPCCAEEIARWLDEFSTGRAPSGGFGVSGFFFVIENGVAFKMLPHVRDWGTGSFERDNPEIGYSLYY
jgi:hypothetical protein